MSELPTTTPNIKKGVFYTAGAAVCWSISGVLVKLIPWSAFTIIGLRSAIAFIVTAIILKKIRISLTKTNILGGIFIFLATFTYIIANKLTTAANAIVLQYTAPVFILLFSVIFQKKRPTRLDICAVCVIFGGIALFFLDALGTGGMLGNLIAVISGVFFAGVFITNAAKGSTPQEATMLGHFLGAITCIPFAFFDVTFELVPWTAIVIMGVVQLGIAYVLLSKGSAHTPPLLASLICSIEPILNPLWVLLAVGEAPSPLALVGMALVILGVVAYQFLLGMKAKSNKI